MPSTSRAVMAVPLQAIVIAVQIAVMNIGFDFSYQY